MTPERWQEIKGVLDQVLDRAAGERKDFLDGRCGGDDDLRREVVSLLESEEDATDFIETPVFRIRSEDLVPMAEGQRIGAYRIVREVGRGGMGAVYLAQRADQEFDRRVALKLIRRGMDSEEILDRFRGERQILAHLDHENIGKLLDGGTTEDGRPYFVMEHVEGEPIDRYCDARQLSIPRRLELFRQVCAAVQFAHQNLVVHRDLKPGNILVTADGVPKLLDFGIAKLLNPEQEAFALTRLELRPMTPAYASPEQVRGEAISTASDVYSLGVLLYRLLTGRSPYRLAPGDPESLSRAIRDEVPAKPSSVVLKSEEVRKPDGSTAEADPETLARARGVNARALKRQLAGDLDNIVLKAMSKEVDRRYASAGQLADDLERQLQGLPVTARKDTARYRTSKFVARHKLGVGLAALLLLVLVVFSITVTVLFQRAVRERNRAEAVVDFLTRIFDRSDPNQAQGEKVTAQDLLDEAVRKISTLQGDPLLKAELQATMASAYRGLGLYETALELYASALQAQRAAGGADREQLVQTLNNMARVLSNLDRYVEAEPLLGEAVKIQESQGLQDLSYARALSNHGEILEKLKKFTEAEERFKKALAVKRKLDNPDEGEVVRTLNRLGNFYQSRGDLGKAEPLIREAYQVRRRLAAGKLDPALVASLNSLAAFLENQGRYSDAEPLYREALAIRRAVYKDHHPEVAGSLNNLGHVVDLLGRPAEAEPLIRKALEIAEGSEVYGTFSRAVFERNLSSALAGVGKGAECERRIRGALKVLRPAKITPPWRILDAESVLGSCLVAQQRFAAAEPLLLAAAAALQAEKDEGALRAPEARKRVVRLYEAWGKPEKAAAFRSGS